MVKEIAAPRRLDSVAASFDDERLIADAGLLLPATPAQRLGLAELLAEKVDLGGREGSARPERKAMTLISGMLAGADSIDDRGMPRAGRAEALLGHRIDELLARIGRTGKEGEILIRADSGFWRAKTFERLEADGIRYSIAVRGADARIAAAITEIPDEEWTTLEDYPEPGLAEIAETTYGGRRLVVRRVRELSDQQQLLPGWRHHPFITNRDEEIEVVEAGHRRHAVVELAIRDLKAGALAHFPSGDFSANSAWTQLAAIAHNLARWSQAIGSPDASPRMLETFRRRLLRIPGRLTRSARKLTLHLPARWPWQRAFVEALERIRELAPAV